MYAKDEFITALETGSFPLRVLTNYPRNALPVGGDYETAQSKGRVGALSVNNISVTTDGVDHRALVFVILRRDNEAKTDGRRRKRVCKLRGKLA